MKKKSKAIANVYGVRKFKSQKRPHKTDQLFSQNVHSVDELNALINSTDVLQVRNVRAKHRDFYNQVNNIDFSHIKKLIVDRGTQIDYDEFTEWMAMKHPSVIVR